MRHPFKRLATALTVAVDVSVDRVYGKYIFDFCVKQRGTSKVTGLLNALAQKRSLLDNLICNYTPAKRTGAKPISFAEDRH